MPEPTKASVVKRLSSFNNLHRACHAHTDSKNPLQGGLILFKPGNGVERVWDTAHLATGEVMRRRYKGDPPFLTASQTVDNPNTSLADEGIHIASAFQVARFTHVVEIRWSFIDDEWVHVTEKFNQFLLRTDDDRVQQRLAARALNGTLIG